MASRDSLWWRDVLLDGGDAMMMWKPTFFSRLGWGFRLVWRTMLVQLVLGGLGFLLIVAISSLAVVLGTSSGVLLFVTVVIGGLLSLLIPFFVGAALLAASAAALEGEGQVAVRAALCAGWRRLPVLANTTVLLMLCALPLLALAGGAAMFHPLLMLLLMVPMVWIGVRLLMVSPVVVLEDVSPWQGVRRAWALSDGCFWRMFGNLLLLMVLMMLLSVVFFLLALALGAGGIAGSLGLMAQGGAMPSMMAGGVGMVLMVALLVGGVLLIQMTGTLLIMAFALLFYGEQRHAEDSAIERWQAAPAAAKLQWKICWGWMLLLALAQGVAAIMAPDIAPGISQSYVATTTSTTVSSTVRQPQPKRSVAKAAASAKKPAHTLLERQRIVAFDVMQQVGSHQQIRRRESQRLVSQLYQRYPKDAWVLQARGWLLYRSGKLAQARSMMVEACRFGAASACLLAQEVK
ncbi:MAG: hypothetical protein R8J84_01450 [Mariprofundales bacterium]